MTFNKKLEKSEQKLYLISDRDNLVTVNGFLYKYEPFMSIYYLLIYLGFNTLLVLVDYNGSILQKAEWKQVFLKQGDQIEIITLAGGG